MTLSIPFPIALTVAVPVLAFGAAAFAVRVLFGASAVRVGGAHLLHGRGRVVFSVTACRVAWSLCGQSSPSAATGCFDWAYAVGLLRGAPISEEIRHPSGRWAQAVSKDLDIFRYSTSRCGQQVGGAAQAVAVVGACQVTCKAWISAHLR